MGKVVADLGFTASTQQLHRLSILVHHAYARLHGDPPIPRIYYDANGTPERLCCYTEAERGLILDVLEKHAGEFYDCLA